MFANQDKNFSVSALLVFKPQGEEHSDGENLQINVYYPQESLKQTIRYSVNIKQDSFAEVNSKVKSCSINSVHIQCFLK